MSKRIKVLFFFVFNSFNPKIYKVRERKGLGLGLGLALAGGNSESCGWLLDPSSSSSHFNSFLFRLSPQQSPAFTSLLYIPSLSTNFTPLCKPPPSTHSQIPFNFRLHGHSPKPIYLLRPDSALALQLLLGLSELATELMKALMMDPVLVRRFACPSSFAGLVGLLSTFGMAFLYSWSPLMVLLPLFLLISVMGFVLFTQPPVWLLKIFLFLRMSVSIMYFMLNGSFCIGFSVPLCRSLLLRLVEVFLSLNSAVLKI